MGEYYKAAEEAEANLEMAKEYELQEELVAELERKAQAERDKLIVDKATAHAIMGGITATLGGGDFVKGAMAGGLNELAAQQLKDELPNSPTLQNAVATIIGGVVGGAGGAMIAGTADKYNRQLHPTEREWIDDNAKDFAEKEGITEQEAKERLSQQALREVDLMWRGLFADGNDTSAQQFLKEAKKEFTNDLGDRQQLFTAEGQQLIRPEMFLVGADLDFYRKYVHSGIHRDLNIGLLKELKDLGIDLGQDILKLGEALLNNPQATFDAVLEVAKELPATVVKDFIETYNAVGQGAAVAFDDELTQKLNSIYKHDVGLAQKVLLASRVTTTIFVSAGVAKAGVQVVKVVGKAGGKVADASREAAIIAMKATEDRLDKVLDDLAREALLKSGGIYGLNGKPLLKLSDLGRKQKELMGELFGEKVVREIVPSGVKIGRAAGVGGKGIDDIYRVSRPDVDYVVIEYKFDKSTLGSLSDGKQGSIDWLLGSKRIEKAVDSAEADLVRKSVTLGRTETWLVRTRPDGSVIVKVLDAKGNIKPADTSSILRQLESRQ